MVAGHIEFKPYSRTDDPDGEFYNLTIGNTATALNTLAPIPTSAVSVILQIEDGDIRRKTDGGNPTSSEGYLMIAGSDYPLVGRDYMTAMKIISASTTAVGTFHVIYSKGE